MCWWLAENYQRCGHVIRIGTLWEECTCERNGRPCLAQLWHVEFVNGKCRACQREEWRTIVSVVEINEDDDDPPPEGWLLETIEEEDEENEEAEKEQHRQPKGRDRSLCRAAELMTIKEHDGEEEVENEENSEAKEEPHYSTSETEKRIRSSRCNHPDHLFM